MTNEADKIPLPAWRYLPGVSERHAEGMFADVKALCPKTTESRNASGNIAWHYGIRLFNEGYYWESHELLEEVWQRTLPNSRERFLIQSVIHLANGGLKSRLGQAKAVRRLAAMAEDCLQRAHPASPKRLMGIDGEAIRQNCRNLISGDDLEPFQLRYEL